MIVKNFKKLIFLLIIISATSATAQTWKKQGSAVIPMVSQNSSCNSTVDTIGISADRSTLLTCQSGSWTNQGGGGGVCIIPNTPFGIASGQYSYTWMPGYVSTVPDIPPLGSSYFQYNLNYCSSAYPYLLDRTTSQCKISSDNQLRLVSVAYTRYCFSESNPNSSYIIIPRLN
ncbi:MAG: hypothetical protein V4724_24000 [Pseudomonadota bacterium]